MIKVDAWLDRAGYTPGETINLNAKIERTTGKTVKKIKIRLVQVYISWFPSIALYLRNHLPFENHVQHTTFVAKSARRRMVKEVYKFSQEWSRNSDSEEAAVIQFSIVVPNVPASGKPFCSIVEIFYELEVTGIVKPSLLFCITWIWTVQFNSSSLIMLELRRMLLQNWV